MIVTHAALTLQSQPAGSPELRRGMPVARCGWQNDGHGVAVAWERRFVDCPMCLLMIDGVNYVPGLGADVHDVSTLRVTDETAVHVPHMHGDGDACHKIECHELNSAEYCTWCGGQPCRVALRGELPMRAPKRPDYVPADAVWVPLEFQGERPRGRHLNLFQSMALWVLVVAAVVTVIALSARWNDTAPSHSPRPAVVTPTPYGEPPDERFTTMPVR